MSKAITETTPPLPPASRRPQGREQAPSVLREDDPGISRYLGMIGALLVIIGGFSLVLLFKFNRPVFGGFWSVLFLCLGLVGLLYHAAFDRDIQFRRVYMFFSYAAMALGVLVSLIPYPGRVGDQFPFGFILLCCGLVFLLAFLRNEDEAWFRDLAHRVLLGAGAGLLAVGLIGGSINSDFLLGIGLLCALLGLVYLFAFLSSHGINDDLGYYVGLGLGGVGALVFLIAAVRSAFYPGESGAYLIPNGLLLMLLGIFAGLLSFGFCSEAHLVVLTRRELGAFFYSPLAYFVLLAFAGTAWVQYYFWLSGLDAVGRPVPEPIVTNFVFGFIPIIVTIVAVPVLTMRLFSEERRTGTLEVMLTAPVGETTVVLSKFFAALFMFLLVWLPFGLFLVALRVMGGKPFDYRPMLAFGVVLLFTGSSFVSLGLLCSSLTRNQLVSGVLCFLGMALLTTIVLVRSQLRNKTYIGIVDHTSYVEMWVNALNGKLIPPELLFHGSLTVLFLFITVKVLEARKWL